MNSNNMNHREVVCDGAKSESLGGPYAEPEVELLRTVFFGADFASRLARAPGGWRTLSASELDGLGLTVGERAAVIALQDLTGLSYPELPRRTLASSIDVARVYQHRLGGLMHEVMLAVCVDGQNHFIAEFEIARGGAHSLGVTRSDVLRPVLRTGASAFLLVHNHPSGNPMPSAEDLVLTSVVALAARVIGVPLIDHVIVGGRGGGFTSLLDLGFIDTQINE